MKLTTEKTGHHYLSDDGTVLSTKKNKGLWDSLGRTARAAVIYDNVGVQEILNFYDNGFVVRHPSVTDLNSRDHVVISLSCLRDLGYWNLIDKLPKTSTGYTPSQWIFFKAIKSHLWSWIYFFYKLPGLAVIIPAWNFFWRVISDSQTTFTYPRFCKMLIDRSSPSKWQKFCFKMTMKTFAIFYTVYEIRGIHNQVARKWLLKVIRVNIEKHNYVLRALTEQKIANAGNRWIPTRSNRWSCRLDRTCDRDMTIHPEDTAENNLEVGMFEYYCKNKEL